MAQVPMPAAVVNSPIGHTTPCPSGAVAVYLQSGDFARCLIHDTGRFTFDPRGPNPQTVDYTKGESADLVWFTPAAAQDYPDGTEFARVLTAADLNGLIANVQDHESRFVAKPTAAGQIPIGHADGTVTQATITAGTNITVTSGEGSISIAAAGSEGVPGTITVRGYNGSSTVIPALSVVHCNSSHGGSPAALSFTLADSSSPTGWDGIVGINLVALEVPTGDPATWDELFTQDVVVQGIVDNPALNVAPAGEVKYFGVGNIRSAGFQYHRAIGYGLTPTSLYVFQSASEDLPLLLSNAWTAKGQILAAIGANNAGALAVGTNGQVLTADSSENVGLKWVTPATPAAGAPTLLPGQCSTSIAVGSVVHAQPQVMGTFLNWEQAEPTSVSQFTIVGIVQATGTSASVAVAGIIPIPETSICPGYAVWLGAGGTLSETSTGDVPKFLGWVVDSTHLYWYPQN